MKESKLLILKTAFKLFLKKSFREVTMKEIVKETGLSKGAFYHYFDSKEQLFIETIDTFYFDKMMIDYKKLSNTSLSEFYNDYIKYISALLNELNDFLDCPYTAINLNYVHIIFDAIKLFPGFHDKIAVLKKYELDSWDSIIKSARISGEISSPMTDEQIARMFLYANDGIALDLLFVGKLEKASEEMQILWDNFYKELKV